jgi:hypothetical protein
MHPSFLLEEGFFECTCDQSLGAINVCTDQTCDDQEIQVITATLLQQVFPPVDDDGRDLLVSSTIRGQVMVAVKGS